MSTTSYITLNGHRFALQDLISRINGVLSDGTATFVGRKLVVLPSNHIGEYDESDSDAGLFRYNNDSATPVIEFSVDGGNTWEVLGHAETDTAINQLSGASITVEPGKVYSVSGEVNGALVISLSGTSATKWNESWIKVGFGSEASITPDANLTVVDEPYPGCVNILRLSFWGNKARLYVQDRWEEGE